MTMKYFSISILFALLTLSGNSQTYISGFISPNSTWTVAGSPYIVTGNALLVQGDTLMINSGVTVKFDAATTLQIDGSLIAIGTSSNHITFTSNQASPQKGDWDELHFSDHASDAVFDSSGNYLSGCILKYCDVLYGGDNNFGLIHVESSSPYISQCTVEHSNTSGVYSNNSSNLPDSTTVNDCTNYGIYYSGCGAAVINDSIKNSLKGGLFLDLTCGIIIRNSYFYNNSLNGAIYSHNDIGNLVSITNSYFDDNNYDNYQLLDRAIISFSCDSFIFDGNYFLNNSYLGNTIGSLIALKCPIISFPDTQSVLIFTNNYIYNNSAKDGTSIMFATRFHSVVLKQNSFINNIVGDYSSASASFQICKKVNIECNLFQNNKSGNSADGALYVYMAGPTLISKNIFDGNHNSSANQRSGARIDGTYTLDTCYFVNNTVINNSSPTGPCIEFFPNIVNQKLLQIHDNNFMNNTVDGSVKLTGYNTGNINLDFIYIKYNNFNDPASPSELYNNIPYGSPNIYADSNYWNGTSSQHLDSTITDYFDNGNLSVVFYQPALASPVTIDTSCTGTTTIISEEAEKSVYPTPSPNPFSNHTTIVFEKELSDAKLTVFNCFGQEAKVMYHLKGYNIRIDRENLKAGIYFYLIADKSSTAVSGKLVVIE